MKIKGIASLILSLGLLTSCTSPYFQHYDLSGTENGTVPFSGRIENSPMDGRANINFNSMDGRVRCFGTMIPAFQDNVSLTCDKAQGSIVMKCMKDNSLFYQDMDLSWFATGCNSGVGNGFTEDGDIIFFSFYPPRY